MKTVQQVSKLTGISVRTLHHYDQIGLLKPTKVTEAGYRLYDETALKRLQAFLFFRELEFPLKQIGEILDRPGFDFSSVLADQIRLLELRAEQLQKLISHARQIQKTGVIPMDFSALTAANRPPTPPKPRSAGAAPMPTRSLSKRPPARPRHSRMPPVTV